MLLALTPMMVGMKWNERENWTFFFLSFFLYHFDFEPDEFYCALSKRNRAWSGIKELIRGCPLNIISNCPCFLSCTLVAFFEMWYTMVTLTSAQDKCEKIEKIHKSQKSHFATLREKETDNSASWMNFLAPTRDFGRFCQSCKFGP